MKWVHKFTVNKEKEVEVTETKTGENGEEITTKRKEVQQVPIEFCIKKPNRKTYDEAELFYGVKLSEGIKAGLLTKTQLAKRYDNDGGPFSEEQKQEYSVILLNLFEKENEVQKLQLNLEGIDEDEKKQKLTTGLIELTKLREQMREFEVFHSSIFDQTAEGRAKNQTVIWWVLFSAHWKEDQDGEFEPVFEGSSFETKLDSYDEIEEQEDLFWSEVIRKFSYFVGFWYSGKASSEDDFKEVERFYNTSLEDLDSEDKEDKEEVEKDGAEKEEVKPEDEEEKSEES
tara:strand:+ start:860 stop:1717 length:858 start_codon:yes stop_codon:yes gene_type:complete